MVGKSCRRTNRWNEQRLPGSSVSPELDSDLALGGGRVARRSTTAVINRWGSDGLQHGRPLRRIGIPRASRFRYRRPAPPGAAAVRPRRAGPGLDGDCRIRSRLDLLLSVGGTCRGTGIAPRPATGPVGAGPEGPALQSEAGPLYKSNQSLVSSSRGERQGRARVSGRPTRSAASTFAPCPAVFQIARYFVIRAGGQDCAGWALAARFVTTIDLNAA